MLVQAAARGNHFESLAAFKASANASNGASINSSVSWVCRDDEPAQELPPQSMPALPRLVHVVVAHKPTRLVSTDGENSQFERQ
jgi:hypothetical protein